MYTQQDLIDAVLVTPIASDVMQKILAEFLQRGIYVSGRDGEGRSVETILWEKGANFLVPSFRRHAMTLNEKRRATIPDPVFYVTVDGDVNAVRRFFNTSPSATPDLEYLLGVAAGCGHVELVRYFVETLRVPADAIGMDGKTPLYAAAGFGRLTVVQYLESQGVSLQNLGIEDKHILHCAVPHPALLDYLLWVKQFNVNLQNYDGKTVAHWAVCLGDSHALTYILQFRPNLDIRDRDEKTAFDLVNTPYNTLMQGTIKDQLQKYQAERIHIQQILAKIASVTDNHANLANLQVNNQDLPEIATALARCPSVHELNLSANALTDEPAIRLQAFADSLFQHTCIMRINLVSNALSAANISMIINRISPTARLTDLLQRYQSVAFGQSHLQQFQQLLAAGADCQQIIVEGWRLVHFAANYGEVALLKLLVTSADITAKTDDDMQQNALHLAAERGHVAVAEFLLAIQSGLLVEDALHVTPLYYAVLAGHEALARCLLVANDNPNHNCHGRCLLKVALEKRYPQIVRLLLEHGASYAPALFAEYRQHLSASDAADQAILALINEYEANEKVLFTAVQSGRLEALETVLKAGTNLQVLDEHYHTALYRAVTHKQFACCARLLVEGAELDPTECSGNPFQKLTSAEQAELKNYLVHYFQRPADAVIAFFVSRSRLACQHKFRSTAQINLQEIFHQLYHQELNKRYVQPVLKVLEYLSIALDVIFDCSVDNVAQINPTEGKGSRGACDFKHAKIYIGAKRPQPELLGTIAHELTHLACQHLFTHDCNPYYANSPQATQFLATCAAIRQRRADGHRLDEIIERAFSEYPAAIQPSELIVRVPHMIAQYGDVGLQRLKSQVPELLEFYETIFLPICRDYVLEKNSAFIRSGATQISMQDNWGLFSELSTSKVDDNVSVQVVAQGGGLHTAAVAATPAAHQEVNTPGPGIGGP